MKILATHEGFVSGAHEGIQESIEGWVQEHLEPLLSHFKGEPRLLATIKHHAKGAAKYSVTLRMHLPRKRILVAHGENPDIHAALAQAEERLLREVKKHKDRLREQAVYRRRVRRARLRELKAAQVALPTDVAKQARGGIEPLLPRLERVVRRELAYLHNSGELPVEYPTVQDVVDEAVAATTADWQAGESGDELLRRLLREAFAALDRDIAASRCYGEMLSLDAAPRQDAETQAEAMVEEEFYEFYQPDDILRVSDVLPDETAIPPEAELEDAQRVYTLETLSDLPIVWRRVLMLSEFERLTASDIAVILEAELAQIEKWLEQARAFLNDHLSQAGFLRE